MSDQKVTSRFDGLFRRLVLRKLDGISRGAITIHDADLAGGSLVAGDPAADLVAHIHVARPRMYRRMVWGGGLGAAAALIDGDFDCDDWTALVRIFIRNLAVADRVEGGSARLRQLVGRLVHWLRRNRNGTARRNIAQHYDLGNDFYRLWLDESMNYSCGIFASREASLLAASTAKMERACQQLELRPADHLLEIGSGWGALALHAASHYGCRVTTTTISKQQYHHVQSRARDAGLADRITVLNQDYRDLRGSFDKLVSIEMIEAVGHQYYATFFQKCGQLLAEDGRMLLQAIVIADERYQQHIRTVDFISQYIFPGGSLPAVSILALTAAETAGMRVLNLQDFGPHYAETLRRWRANLEQQLDQVRRLGYDERFIRMWRYYLCYCEAAFEEHQANLVQMLLAKRACQAGAVGWSQPAALVNRRATASAARNDARPPVLSTEESA